ncbi:MAG: hypothetical protein ACOCUT_03345 [bacterium]
MKTKIFIYTFLLILPFIFSNSLMAQGRGPAVEPVISVQPQAPQNPPVSNQGYAFNTQENDRLPAHHQVDSTSNIWGQVVYGLILLLSLPLFFWVVMEKKLWQRPSIDNLSSKEGELIDFNAYKENKSESDDDKYRKAS